MIRSLITDSLILIDRVSLFMCSTVTDTSECTTQLLTHAHLLSDSGILSPVALATVVVLLRRTRFLNDIKKHEFAHLLLLSLTQLNARCTPSTIWNPFPTRTGDSDRSATVAHHFQHVKFIKHQYKITPVCTQTYKHRFTHHLPLALSPTQLNALTRLNARCR